jgi:CSLREA domain-containing protein
MRTTILLAALLLSAAVFMSSPAQAGWHGAGFYVNSTADEPDANPGDGTCAGSPSGLCTLRAAIQEANALAGSDTIVLSGASYALAIPGQDEDLAASGDLDILESLTIKGAGTSATIIDAGGLDRALQIFSPAVVSLTDLTIQGGDSGSGLGRSGGGIAQASGSRLELSGVAVSGNKAGDSGGGIYNNGGELILRQVRVVANSARTAAGIRNAGSLNIQDSSIAGNQAAWTGGGILNTGSLILDRSTVSGNVAGTNGGGLYLHSDNPLTGQVTIQNSTISGNQANSFMGGGIWVYYQTELAVSSSTITGNTAGQGGGIFNYHQQDGLLSPSFLKPKATAQEGNILLHNTIVANNTFANCGRSSETFAIVSQGYNLDSDSSCEFAHTGDLNNLDPNLGPLQNNGGQTLTHALNAGSAAIDNGDDAGCPATDQRGVKRPQMMHCDIGAYEARATNGGFNAAVYLPMVTQ